jgi:hypothetical protein
MPRATSTPRSSVRGGVGVSRRWARTRSPMSTCRVLIVRSSAVISVVSAVARRCASSRASARRGPRVWRRIGPSVSSAQISAYGSGWIRTNVGIANGFTASRMPSARRDFSGRGSLRGRGARARLASGQMLSPLAAVGAFRTVRRTTARPAGGASAPPGQPRGCRRARRASAFDAKSTPKRPGNGQRSHAKRAGPDRR